jgi:endonuclease/exonuclease/phosphatase family metal-dependent hydrolase
MRALILFSLLAAGCIGPSVADGGVDAGRLIVAGESWGNVQSPVFATRAPNEPLIVFGQLWLDGGTPMAGAHSGVVAQLGWGPSGSNPATDEGWTWVPAAFHADVGDRDEFSAQLVAPAAGGAYSYAYRYQLEPGAAWSYADRSDERRKGTDDGYQPENAGHLAVRASGGSLRVAQQNLHCINNEPAQRLDRAALRYAEMGLDAVALQEACIDPVLGNTADLLATRLQALTGQKWRAFFEPTHLANNVTQEGVAVVTRLPVATWSRTDLPTRSLSRGTLQVVAASPVGMVSISTDHLSFEQTQTGSEDRLNQARAVVAFEQLVASQVAAQVVAGDFNTSPGDPAIETILAAGFVDVWAATNASSVPGATFPAGSPQRRIDYIFARGLSPVSSQREFLDPNIISDHLGVSAHLVVP